MNPKQASPPPSGISLSDVYYILFRHKWLIVILSAVAAVAAVAVLIFWHVPYESEARLLIKYVKEIKPPDQSATDAQVTSPDSRGDDIINTEIEILTSMDVANSVVDALTPARILAKDGGGTNRALAAIKIRTGLVPDVAKRSDVIDLVFSHPDPDMVQPILNQIIDNYLKKHTEVHGFEYNDFLTRQTDEVKHKLDDTETQLRDAKNKAGMGIMSPDDSKKMIADMTSKIQQEIYESDAQEADFQETIKAKQKLLAGSSPATVSTNLTVPAAPAAVPPDKVTEYQRVCTSLFTEQSKEQELLATYTTNYPSVQAEETQVAKSEALKANLEKNYPGLLGMQPVASSHGGSGVAAAGVDPAVDLNEEIIKSEALEARIKVLTNEMAEVRNNAAAMMGQEGTILQLQRDRDMEEAEFTYYSQRLEESRADEAFSGNSNISLVEAPTPPFREMKKVYKVVAMIFLGGLAFAFGFPFIIELYLDRTLKHPLEVQSTLGLPFFISIPAMNGNGKTHTLKGNKKKALPPAKSAVVAGQPDEVQLPSASPINGHLALWQHDHGLQPFYETLRDRLMTYFEMINLTHKPKLVAVTSCAPGAGVTSTAAGLASSLSETGEGNVLLVDMNARNGEVHHFYKGKLSCGLDDVLEKDKREGALVQGNLYVAREQENDDKLPRILPKRFSHLLPKMKASDFDYIIFDMPPVSQISITPRLARFMDMVLLVVESEKTDRDVAKRVSVMLSETKTNVGIVLNKNHSYLPRRLHQEV